MGCTSSNQTTDQVICQVSNTQKKQNAKLNIGINLDSENSEKRMFSITKNPIVQRRIQKSTKPQVLLTKQHTAETYVSIY
ncbi:unnamed protein product [Paramecium sonneborni]|uniref:Uncharacterized protein n=1 Tax=Paramecium sonneborni TaxID=65129 RepID=A0A8S1NAM6_9CILI|nr:unnamed protein product [Paramecium sonneborni]